MTMKSLTLLATAVLGLSAFTPIVRADNPQQVFTTIPQNWLGAFPQSARLTNGGTVIVPFVNPLGGIVSVTYTAECPLIAAPTSWLHVTVLIDNVAVLPSGGDAALCSGRGAGVSGGWIRTSITVSRVLAAGNHTVTVNGQVTGAHTGARLDDTSLLVER